MSEDELDIIEWLRRSKNALGQIYPILVKKGSVFEIIDGRHRSQADPTWRRVEIEPPKDWPFSEEAYYLAVRIAANYRRRVSRKERQTEFLMLASQLEEEGVSREKIVSTISKITGFSERWVQKLLPPKYKATEKAHKKKMQKKTNTGDESVRHPKSGSKSTKIATLSEPSDKKDEELIPHPKTEKRSTKIVISSAPSDERPDIDRDIAEGVVSENVKWILDNSTSDVNYKATIPRLSDAELEYCLRCETRESGRRQLLRELERRRGAVKPKLVRTLTCPRCHVEIRTVYCTKCFSELEVREIAKILKKEMMEASE